MVFTLFKMCTETIQISKNLLKIEGLNHFVILLKSLKVLELVLSLHNRSKNKLKMVVIRSTIILLHFISILFRIPKKQSKVQLLIYSNVCEGVTDFEICGTYQKHKNLHILETKHYFFLK